MHPTSKGNNGAVHPSYKKSEVSIVLWFQLRSTHYTVVQIKSYVKRTFVLKVKIWTISVMQRKPSHATTKLTFFCCQQKRQKTKEDTGKSTKKALYVHAAGTSWVEVTSNSKKK